jgi:NADPH:quinone reductase-like Zn-dependent oxidoreductase
MKAAVYERFGPPEVLFVKDIEKPVLKDNEVLVRVRATTVEKDDPLMRKMPGINGIFKPKVKVLGLDFSGDVETVGKAVKFFKAGDPVFGNTGLNLGTCAEYVGVAEDGAIVHKPSNMSYEEIVAVTDGAITAIPFLREAGRISAGQKILINGASGTVGSAAVQMAVYFGAKVTGVCSTGNMEIVRSLGAEKVIDYTKEDFTELDEVFDIVFDAAGKSSFSKCRKILKEGGIYLTTIPAPSAILGALLPSAKGAKKAGFMATGLRQQNIKAKDLAFLIEMIEAGKYRAIIDRTYPLEQIVEAHKYVERGRKKGSVVITISHT